jgi:hypothetical protein
MAIRQARGILLDVGKTDPDGAWIAKVRWDEPINGSLEADIPFDWLMPEPVIDQLAALTEVEPEHG